MKKLTFMGNSCDMATEALKALRLVLMAWGRPRGGGEPGGPEMYSSQATPTQQNRYTIIYLLPHTYLACLIQFWGNGESGYGYMTRLMEVGALKCPLKWRLTCDWWRRKGLPPDGAGVRVFWSGDLPVIGGGGRDSRLTGPGCVSSTLARFPLEKLSTMALHTMGMKIHTGSPFIQQQRN